MTSALRIGTHVVRHPIIQGAMAVRVSGANLAGAVAEAGGIGLISSFGIGFQPQPDGGALKRQDLAVANQEALGAALCNARQISPRGVIGVNILVAAQDYPSLARTAAAQGANLIVTGAGLPLDLPAHTQNYPEVALVPIVADLAAAQTLCEAWQRHYQRLPDALILENSAEVAGHFTEQGIATESTTSPEFGQAELGTTEVLKKDVKLTQTLTNLRGYLQRLTPRPIPILVTGGIWDRADVERMMAMGADGVQVGTRFITTQECDAAPQYKAFYLQAHAQQLVTVPSPAGKPTRAIRNAFADRVLQHLPTRKRQCLNNCLTHCLYRDQGQTFCLLQALARAAAGDVEQGLMFASGSTQPVESLLSVKDLMASLV